MILLATMWKAMFPQDDPYCTARMRMIIEQIRGRGITDQSVIEAMKKVPRHKFVPSEYMNQAYNDYPLPIGYDQTISQPYIVACMTEAVKPLPWKKALEIGTGSGYQAAVLSELVDTVFSIEIIEPLAEESYARLKVLGYENVVVRSGDGYHGWKEHAPYDIIIVTAAPEDIPAPLTGQLAENGLMIIPVGKEGAVQELVLLEKKNGKIVRTRLNFVRFVPFRRSH